MRKFYAMKSLLTHKSAGRFNAFANQAAERFLLNSAYVKGRQPTDLTLKSDAAHK